MSDIKATDGAIDWDCSVDFLSVGSGGGGMTGALTASIEGLDSLVIEKSDKFGGTTALSGGVIWIPNNHLMASANIIDSTEDGRRYLDQVVSADVPREKIASRQTMEVSVQSVLNSDMSGNDDDIEADASNQMESTGDEPSEYVVVIERTFLCCIHRKREAHTVAQSTTEVQHLQKSASHYNHFRGYNPRRCV